MNTRFATYALAAVLGLTSVVTAGCGDDGPTTGEEQNVTSKSGRFETFKGSDGKYYFSVIAGNYEKVLRSQGYTSKAAAETGIKSIKKNAVSAKSFKVLEATNGDYYFNVVAGNGEIVGTSELYSTKSSAQRGAESVRALIGKQLRTEAAATGGAEFEVFEGSDGDTFFHLRAANGEIVLVSEGYADEADALESTESVRVNGRDAARFDVLEASNGQYFFHLQAKNGEIIGLSEIYGSKSDAERGRDAVIALALSEKIADAE